MHELRESRKSDTALQFAGMIGLCLLAILPIAGNTERDIGPMPLLNQITVNHWILFYTNVERMQEGLWPLAYDPILEKAVNYIANYCAKELNNSPHDIREPGMQSMSDRIKHFGGIYSMAGENLTVSFRSNSESIHFYEKSDDKGGYRDFGDHTIYWRNERQLAHAMVDSWMRSSGHRANIMTSGYTAMGAGAAVGIYGGHESGFGSQVSTDYQAIDFAALKWNSEKKTYAYSGKLEPVCFLVAMAKQPVIVPVVRSGVSSTGGATDGQEGLLFVGLFDAGMKITYPVLKVR